MVKTPCILLSRSASKVYAKLGMVPALREEGEASGGVNSSRTDKGDNGFLVWGIIQRRREAPFKNEDISSSSL